MQTQTVRHFFPWLHAELRRLTDPRNQKLIIYRRETILWAMLLLLIMRQGAKRQLQARMNAGKNMVANLEVMSQQAGLQRLPHGDSAEYLSMRLRPEELEQLQAKLAGSLLRGRALEAYRLQGKYYTVAIDGVHVYSFDYAHCAGCLVKEEQEGKRQWQHDVLKASLVTWDGWSIPLVSEWIENTGGYNKQDCERKAFYRLVRKLQKHFPRLPICVLLDALYACQPVLEALAEAKLEWITVFKAGSMPEVYAWEMQEQARHAENQVLESRYVKQILERRRRNHAERLERRAPEKRMRKVIETRTYRWGSESHWRDGKVYNIVRCKEEYDAKLICDYTWLVSDGLKLNEKTVEELAEKGGR